MLQDDDYLDSIRGIIEAEQANAEYAAGFHIVVHLSHAWQGVIANYFLLHYGSQLVHEVD